jgi:hypothetical protein
MLNAIFSAFSTNKNSEDLADKPESGNELTKGSELTKEEVRAVFLHSCI